VVSSANKTDGHNITALLLNGALNTIKKKKRTNNAIVLLPYDHGHDGPKRIACEQPGDVIGKGDGISK
jgi:hypothetical protein